MTPSRSRLLDVNSTSVLVHLSTWGHGGCDILHYVIEYKLHSSRVSVSTSRSFHLHLQTIYLILHNYLSFVLLTSSAPRLKDLIKIINDCFILGLEIGVE